MVHLNKGFRSKGFTLIELMIVIAVVAILVALAVPAYKDYAVRAKITECVNGAAVAKIQISEYRQTLGAWPPSMVHAGIDAPSGASNFCVGFTSYQPGTGAFAVEIDETKIGVTAGDVLPLFTPTELSSNIINWKCTRGATPGANVKFLPGPCRGV